MEGQHGVLLKPENQRFHLRGSCENDKGDVVKDPVLLVLTEGRKEDDDGRDTHS